MGEGAALPTLLPRADGRSSQKETMKTTHSSSFGPRVVEAAYGASEGASGALLTLKRLRQVKILLMHLILSFWPK